MRLLAAVAWLVVLAPIAYSQTTPPPVPFDSAVLTWTVPPDYATGGTLADPIDIQYIVEVSGPGGNGWGPAAIVRGTNTFRFDNLAPGLWSFRVKTIIHGASFSLASPIVTKNVMQPTTAAPVVTGVTAR